MPSKSDNPPLSAFDLDGTLLVKNSSFAFCSYLYRKKVLSLSAFATCVICYLLHKYCGASSVWLHHAVFNRLFKGKKLSFLISHIDSFLDEHLDKALYLPALNRLLLRQKENAHLIILSNSPIFLVRAIAKRLRVGEVVATDYTVDEEGKLSEISRIVDGKQKAEYLDQIPAQEKEVYTDSMLDLPFLESASKKVVVRPSRALKALAKAKGWELL